MVRFMYLRDKTRRPVGCLAIKKVADGVIHYQVSVCNSKDHFDRKEARYVAVLRLLENPLVVNSDFVNTGIGIARVVMSDVASKSTNVVSKTASVATKSTVLPRQAVKAARLWVNSAPKKTV